MTSTTKAERFNLVHDRSSGSKSEKINAEEHDGAKLLTSWRQGSKIAEQCKRRKGQGPDIVSTVTPLCPAQTLILLVSLS